MIQRYFFILILTGLLFGGVFGWKFYQIRVATNQNQLPPPPMVAVTEVLQTTWQPYLTAVGSLVANAGIDVSNEPAGKVNAIHFTSGQFVKQGQPLIDLDTSTDEAELKSLLAEEQLAAVRFERNEKMLAKNFVSKSDYDLSKAQRNQALANVEAKRAAIAKKRITAPFSGRLGIRMVDVGQYLAEGTAIVPLQDLDPIYADFMLPESRLAELSLGQTLTLAVQTYPGQTFKGEVTALNPGIDAGTRSIKVRATLDNPQEALRPGMFADVTLTAKRSRQVLTLPDTAITYNPYGDSVFAVVTGKQGTTVALKQIVTGESRGGRVEIVQGLKAGEKVVSAGQIKLRNGMAVVLDQRPAPGERESGQ